MAHLSIAALQLELNVEDNLALIEREIRSVVKRFPFIQMVVLPELCTFGPNPDLAVALPGEVENCFRSLASEHQVWLIPGSIFERKDNEIYNTAPVIDPEGNVIARYRKQYPFCPFEKGVASGDQFVVFDVPGVGRLGVVICYDMWFPEVIRTLSWMGAEAIICPTLTNTVDRNVELAIAQANAVTNQLYFLNVNSAGTMGFGRSVFVGPDGIVIHQASSSREIINVEIDFERVRRVRERGSFSLTQTLKSFREHKVEFPQYRDAQADPGAYGDLGPLTIPEKEPLE